MSDDQEFAAHRRPLRYRSSAVRKMAPDDETVLSVMCGSRLLARVWPRTAPAADRYLVTPGAPGLAADAVPMSSEPRLAVVAHCRCGRSVHTIDLDRVAESADLRGAARRRRPATVEVARVEATTGDDVR